MAPVVPVPSLIKLTLDYMEQRIVHYLTIKLCSCKNETHSLTWKTVNDCSTLSKTRRELQETLPPVLLQELLQNLLKSECMVAHFGALQLLMNKHVKQITLHSDPYVYRKSFLQNLVEHGDGLLGLQVEYFWFKEQEIPLLRQTLGGLRNLLSLTLRVECDVDSVLLTVGQSCPQMQNLDVSRSCHPSEAGILQLCFGESNGGRGQVTGRRRNPCCRTLEAFATGAEYVNRSDLPPALLSLLIQACPNLQALPTYPYSGEALVLALESLDQADMSGFQTRLRYLCDTKTDVERLKMLAAICPELERLCLYSTQPLVFGSLHLLTRVKELSLQAIGWDGLAGYLQRHGKVLQFLKLDGAARSFLEMQLARGTLNLAVVAGLCPNLCRLQCQDTTVVWRVDDPSLRHSRCHQPYFSRLTHLALWGCDLPKASLIRLLSSCPQLEELRAFSCSKMDDRDLSAVLTQNPFLRLRTFCVKQAEELTVASVKLLIDTCPRLAWVGCLACWKVSAEELKQLRVFVRRANLDVYLSEYGKPERERE